MRGLNYQEITWKVLPSFRSPYYHEFGEDKVKSKVLTKMTYIWFISTRLTFKKRIKTCVE